jgi:hypothetical protein
MGSVRRSDTFRKVGDVKEKSCAELHRVRKRMSIIRKIPEHFGGNSLQTEHSLQKPGSRWLEEAT